MRQYLTRVTTLISRVEDKFPVGHSRVSAPPWGPTTSTLGSSRVNGPTTTAGPTTTSLTGSTTSVSPPTGTTPGDGARWPARLLWLPLLTLLYHRRSRPSSVLRLETETDPTYTRPSPHLMPRPPTWRLPSDKGSQPPDSLCPRHCQSLLSLFLHPLSTLSFYLFI